LKRRQARPRQPQNAARSSGLTASQAPAASSAAQPRAGGASAARRRLTRGWGSQDCAGRAWQGQYLLTERKKRIYKHKSLSKQCLKLGSEKRIKKAAEFKKNPNPVTDLNSLI